MRNPGLMDPRIFRDQPMELEETLLGIGIGERVSYDAERNILFLNLEGLHVRNRDDVDRVSAGRRESAARPSARKLRWS